jgi:predicted RNA-binding Zn ribbon-like protein
MEKSRIARTPAFFVGGAPGIDFLNSIATPVDKPIDWMIDGAGLVDWLHQANLVPADVLDAIKSGATPRDLDRVASRARDIREWFRFFVKNHRGRPIVAKVRELVPINRLLESDESFSCIVANGSTGRLHIERARRWRSPESLLIPLAEAIAQVVVGEDFTKLKICEGAKCSLVFMDRTRGGRRRWCSMEVCGNRAKVAAHRKRVRAAVQRKSARRR